MEEKLKQGDVVKYSITSPQLEITKGKGVICGEYVSRPVVGRTYIVKDLSGNWPNETYPFTHVVLYETNLTKISATKNCLSTSEAEGIIKEKIAEIDMANIEEGWPAPGKSKPKQTSSEVPFDDMKEAKFKDLLSQCITLQAKKLARKDPIGLLTNSEECKNISQCVKNLCEVYLSFYGSSIFGNDFDDTLSWKVRMK